MNWRAQLSGDAFRKVHGLPPDVFSLLIRTLGRICDDPYDPVFSSPAGGVPGERVADLGESGFIEFFIDEAAGVVRVSEVVWTG